MKTSFSTMRIDEIHRGFGICNSHTMYAHVPTTLEIHSVVLYIHNAVSANAALDHFQKISRFQHFSNTNSNFTKFIFLNHTSARVHTRL